MGIPGLASGGRAPLGRSRHTGLYPQIARPRQILPVTSGKSRMGRRCRGQWAAVVRAERAVMRAARAVMRAVGRLLGPRLLDGCWRDERARAAKRAVGRLLDGCWRAERARCRRRVARRLPGCRHL